MTTNYDRIARFYDVDMARNMAFDDVGFYAALVGERRGCALELGCGNGRILMPLLAAGRDAVGIDASEGMLRELRRKASELGVAPPAVSRMDVRALAFRRGSFATVLCPYSLATYLVDPGDFERMAAQVRDVLEADGLFVVDVFVPRPVSSQPEFVRDYRRTYPGGELERWKRITALSPSRNRIERRYLDYSPSGELREAIEVAEVIRPYARDELERALGAAGFDIVRTWWDYGTGDEPGAQFLTVGARAATARR